VCARAASSLASDDTSSCCTSYHSTRGGHEMITRHMSIALHRCSPCTPSPGAPAAEGGARARPPRPHSRSACRARHGTRAAPRSRVRSSTCRVEVMTPHGPRDSLRLPSRRPDRAPRRTGPRKTSQCVGHRLRRAGAQSADPSATRADFTARWWRERLRLSSSAPLTHCAVDSAATVSQQIEIRQHDPARAGHARPAW
jgi:hypothetical protein